MSSVVSTQAQRLLWVSFDGTLAGGLGSSRDTVASVLPTLISESQNVVPISLEGVGSGLTPAAQIFGVLCGWGTQRNVITAYKNIARTYRPGDKIILCGYSRGAWAARYLALIISVIGLPKWADSNFFTLLDKHCDRDPSFQSVFCPELLEYDRWTDVEIEALCCFDTVGSLGLPLFGIAKPLSLLRRGPRKEDTVSTVATNVKNSFHCLALHEEREPFSPTYMSGTNVHQVFFVGNHGDMGWIDRRKQSFVHAALAWAIQQLHWHSGISFDDEKLVEYFPRYLRATGGDFTWGNLRVTRPTRRTLAFMGRKVRQPWKVVGRCLHTSNNSESTRLDTDLSDTSLPEVQIHIGARYYDQPNAVPGYAQSWPVGGEFHWVRQGCTQQPPRGIRPGTLPRHSSSSSSSLKSSLCSVINSTRLATLPGSELARCDDKASHRIYEALVGPFEARLLGLPAEVVSTRTCCAAVPETVPDEATAAEAELASEGTKRQAFAKFVARLFSR